MLSGIDFKDPKNRIGKRFLTLKQHQCVLYEDFKDIIYSFKYPSSTIKPYQYNSFGIPEDSFKKILTALECYNDSAGCVDYFKFLGNMLRYKSQINVEKSEFYPVKSKEDIANMNKDVVIRKIQRVISKKLANVRQKIDKEKFDQHRAIPHADSYDLSQYSHDQLIRDLRYAIEKSKNNPRDISMMPEYIYMQQDDRLDLATFKKILREKLVVTTLSDNFIEQAFEMFDLYCDNRFSWTLLIKTIYGEFGADYYKTPENDERLLDHINLCLKRKFSSARELSSKLNPDETQPINVYVFRKFIQGATRLKHKEAERLFNMLDTQQKGYINSESFLQALWTRIPIHTPKVIGVFPTEKSRNQSRDHSEIFSSKPAPKTGFDAPADDDFFAGIEMGGFAMGGFDRNDDGFGMEGIETVEHDDDLGKEVMGAFEEFGSRASLNRSSERAQIDEIEELVMNISLRGMSMIKHQGRSLKEIYNMFADKLTHLLTFDGFKDTISFITDRAKFREDVLKACYEVFKNPFSKKISYEKFLSIFDMGKKMNPLYIEVKKKYGENMVKYKALYKHELEKLDLNTGNGFVRLSDVKKLFGVNKIQLTATDCEFLQEERIIFKKDGVDVLSSRKLIEKCFPEYSEFQKFSREICAKKMQRAVRRYNVHKVEIQRQDEFLDLLGQDGDSDLGFDIQGQTGHSTDKSKKVKFQSDGKGGASKRQDQEDHKKLQARKKVPKQIYEFENPDDSLLSEDEDHAYPKISRKPSKIESKKPAKGTPRSQANARIILTAQEKMDLVLRNTTKPRDPMLQIHREKITEGIRSLILEISNTAVSFGESMLLTKNIHRKYSQRPVMKNVFVLMEEQAYDAIDIMPNS